MKHQLKSKPAKFKMAKTEAMRATAVVLLCCLVGWGLVRLSHAATFAVPQEAESGTVTGNAATAPGNGASGIGSNTVQFGVSTTPPPPGGTDITTYGAVCNGVADDTSKIQTALDATKAGQTLLIPAGKSCVHTKSITAKNAGMRLVGPGRLVATTPGDSRVIIGANNITFEGDLKLSMPTKSTRVNGSNSQKILVQAVSGTVLRNITIESSGGMGIKMFGSDHYLVQDVKVSNTLADGIHSTNGAHDGTIIRPVLTNVGDDAVAVVSYSSAGVPIDHDIMVDSPRLYGHDSTNGRGFTVVGGNNITFKNIYSEYSPHAAIYVSAEASFNTYGSNNIKYLGGTLLYSNTRATISDPDPARPATVDHGAILISAYNPGFNISNVIISDMDIRDTDAGAAKQVSIISKDGSFAQNIQLLNLHISRGPQKLLNLVGTPDTAYKATGWTFNGNPVVDKGTYAP